jgi:hypothetical protein
MRLLQSKVNTKTMIQCTFSSTCLLVRMTLWVKHLRCWSSHPPRYGYIYIWMHDCLATWLHGYTETRIHRYTDTQIHGYTDARIHGCMDAWMHGYMYDVRYMYDVGCKADPAFLVMAINIYICTWMHVCMATCNLQLFKKKPHSRSRCKGAVKLQMAKDSISNSSVL